MCDTGLTLCFTNPLRHTCSKNVLEHSKNHVFISHYWCDENLERSEVEVFRERMLTLPPPPPDRHTVIDLNQKQVMLFS